MKRRIKGLIVMVWIILPLQIFSQDSSTISFMVNSGPGQSVIIEWRRDYRDDSLPYEIQRSRNKVIWEGVSTVLPDPSHHYINSDVNTGEGLIYYRIAQRQPGGQWLYSDVKWVQIGKSGRLYVWPNPANNIINVKTTFDNGSITLLDSEGRLLNKTLIRAEISQIPTNNLPSGIYFLYIQHGTETMVERITKQQAP